MLVNFPYMGGTRWYCKLCGHRFPKGVKYAKVRRHWWRCSPNPLADFFRGE